MRRAAWSMLLMCLAVACSDTGGGTNAPADGATDTARSDAPTALDVASNDVDVDVLTSDRGDDLIDVTSEFSDVDQGDIADAIMTDAEGLDASTDADLDAAMDASLDATLDAAMDSAPEVSFDVTEVSDVELGQCSLCHGDYDSPAPPRSTIGDRLTN